MAKWQTKNDSYYIKSEANKSDVVGYALDRKYDVLKSLSDQV